MRIEDVGNQLLHEHCHGYTTSSSSHLIPTVFNNQYPEERDNSTGAIPLPTHRMLSKKERDRYTGIMVNQAGELCEYEVYKLFHQLQFVPLSEPFLLLWSLDLDNTNDRSIKETQLKLEFPSLDLSRVNMKGELDFVVIVKHVGVVLIECKASARPEQLEKSRQQLDNGRMLLMSLMGGMRGTGTSFLPGCRVTE